MNWRKNSFHLLAIIAALVLTATGAPGAQAQGGTGFGSGLEVCKPPIRPVTLENPTVITDCTRAGIQTALETGGHITFDCGADPVTIPISSELELNPEVDTVIDGKGLVTLDGQNQSRILYKGWHDPDKVASVNVTVQNLRFINAKAPGGSSTGSHSGGAINVGHPGTRMHVINCTFENNATTDVHTTDNQGGAIFVSNSYETVIVGSIFKGNSAGNGGAFGGISTGLFIFNSRFEGNHAVDDSDGGIVRGYGGAVHLDGVTNNYNPNSNKRVHVCGCEFEGNTSYRGGGATVVTVSDNKGTKVTYEKSSFINNEVQGLLGHDKEYGQGGAIYHIEDDHAGGTAEDNLEILDSTFHGNKALRQGGGAWLYVLGRGYVTNSTFEANTTTAPFNSVGQGGGMVITLGKINLTNVTFANNHAAYQAGALFGGGANDSNRVITLKNTIFYNNTLNEQDEPTETKWQGYHTNRPMNDGGQNIQYPELKPTYNNKVNNNITPNPIYVDPLLKPLGDYGGYNQTLALKEGSPAIDAGATPCPATDQRGVARVAVCDIGAYEYVPNRITVTPTVAIIPPGGTATYTIEVETQPGFTPTLALTVDNPYASLNVNLDPTSIVSGETALLTAVDTHGGTSLLPGLWHTLTITAAGGELALSTNVHLLVGGMQIYLPLTLKQ